MSEVNTFKEQFPSIESYYRSLILFGKNTASYKFSLSKSLLKLAGEGKTNILLSDLADNYSFNICEHLKFAGRQCVGKDGTFIRACKDYNNNLISKNELISKTIQHGFNYVLDAFHIVNNEDIPIKFFEKDFNSNNKKIILTDNIFKLLETPFSNNFINETEARWKLVETAWDLNISKNILNVNYDNDKELFFVDNYLKRKDITSARNALNGYQKGKCFYCFADINTDDDGTNYCVVDHFFPHTLKSQIPFANLDGVWNLVLACPNCNRGSNGKFARIPAVKYLERLRRRNEFLIYSHHPLRETLILQTGDTTEKRCDFIKEVDKIAINSLIHRWEAPPVGEEIF